jgi:Flp pilus assembly protein TadG
MRSTKAIRQRGTQLVEFAIILPMLVLMFFVVTEGTAMIRVHQVLNNAAREGARMASSDNLLYGPDNTTRTNERNQIINSVKTYVCENMKGCVLNDPDPTKPWSKIAVTISPDEVQVTNPSTGSLMDTTIVTVQYPYTLQYLPAFSLGIVSNTYNLGARAQFRTL